MALEMKYFILKPKGCDDFALASREAMLTYAAIIKNADPELAEALVEWVIKEKEVVSMPEIDDNR